MQKKEGRLLVVAVLLAWSVFLHAQTVFTVSGTVFDGHSRQRLAHVSVTAEGVGTVTNEHGEFVLKTPRRAEVLLLSHLGFQTKRVALSGSSAEGLQIWLAPVSVSLDEVLVRSLSAEEIVMEALRKIPDNYSSVPVLYKGFYRETVQKRQRFISISEAVVNLYKTSYTQSIGRDAVSITRGRRLLSMKSTDTLGVKVMGGPVLPIIGDIVKNRELLFDPEDLPSYQFSFGMPDKLDDQMQYVILMTPRFSLPYAQFSATLYIEQRSLAITRAELQLDMSDRQKATDAMLVSKPATLRFRPRELSFSIHFRTQNGVTHLNYIRNTMRFNCDWKRRLFSSPFTAISEFVATGHTTDSIRPIRGHASFSRRDKLYDHVEYFSDPDFWGTDNIIEPTETLDKAVERLKERLK